MSYDWILDVLADMRNFAASNGLPGLAEQLTHTSKIATAEIADRRRQDQASGSEEPLEKRVGEGG